MNISGVEIKNVSKSFDGHYVLRDIFFTLSCGRLLTLVGPNGAGKTTLANILAGLLPPSSGQVFIDGANLFSNRSKFQKKMGLVIHETLLYEDLTVYENLKFYARLYSVKDSEVVIKQILETVGLEHKTSQRSRNLSRGMHQRLSIGRSMIPDPDIFIFDEPFSNLDLDSTKTVVEILQKLKSQGKLIFLTTHNLEITSQVSDEILILHQGHICKTFKEKVGLEGLEREYIELTKEVEPGIIP